MRDFVPNFENGKLIQQILAHVLNLLAVLDAFLDEHHDLLMVVVDVVVLQDLAFCVVAQHLQELFTFAVQLLADLLHYVHVPLVCGELNVKVDFLNKLNEIYFFRRNDVPNIRVNTDILVVNFELLELRLSVPLVQRVLSRQLKVNTRRRLLQVKILTRHHPLIRIQLLQRYLVPRVKLLLIARYLK